MHCEYIDMAKKAQRLYSLSLEFENKIPASLVKFSMDMCSKYTRIAKEKRVAMDEYEVERTILK